MRHHRRVSSPVARLAQATWVIELALVAGVPIHAGALEFVWFRDFAGRIGAECVGFLRSQPHFRWGSSGGSSGGSAALRNQLHSADMPSGHGLGPQTWQGVVERGDP